MDRRAFVRLVAAAPLASSAAAEPTPRYRVVTSHAPAPLPGMPGPFPGRVARVRSDKCIDPIRDVADAEVVREMMARGMCSLTGETQTILSLAAEVNDLAEYPRPQPVLDAGAPVPLLREAHIGVERLAVGQDELELLTDRRRR